MSDDNGPVLGWLGKITGYLSAPLKSNLYREGLEVSASNPVPISGTVVSTGAELRVEIPIESTAYDLATTSYSATTAITGSWIFNRIEFNFSSNAARTILITSSDGTVLASAVAHASANLMVEGEVGDLFESGKQINISVSQTTGPCLMDVVMYISRGQLPLSENPSLAESNAEIGKIRFADSTGLDAFGRQRVSSPQSLFSVKQIYPNTDLFYGDFGDGEIEPTPSKAGTIIRIPAGIIGIHTYCSHRHIQYQPGKSSLEQITGVWGTLVPGIIRRLGIRNFFNERVYIEQNGDNQTAYTVVESYAGGVLDRREVERLLWLDRLDGTGGAENKSGVLVDPTKNHLISFDWQWLSAGRLRFNYSFEAQPTVFDIRNHGNVLDLPWVRCPDMQVFWEIETTKALLVDAEFLSICAAVSSEGGQEPSGINYGKSTGGNPVTVGTTYKPVIAIRSAPTYKGEPNIISGRLNNYSVNSNADIIYQIVWFPASVTGGQWNPVGGHSSMEFNITATLVGGGQVIEEALLAASGTGSKAQGGNLADILAQQEVICRNADNSGGLMMVIAARAITGTADVHASMKWVESLG